MADQYQKHLDNFAAHKDDLISQLRAKGSQQMFEVASLRGDTRYTIPRSSASCSWRSPSPVLPSSHPLPRSSLSGTGRATDNGINHVVLERTLSSSFMSRRRRCCCRRSLQRRRRGLQPRWEERRCYRRRSYFLDCLSSCSALSFISTFFAYLSQPLTRNVTSGEKVGRFSSKEL